MSGGGRERRCISCREEYDREREGGTCKECYEEASETEEELKREIHQLHSKLTFLRSSSSSFHDVLLIAADADADADAGGGPLPAHKAVLADRSPVFKAMLESEMEERRSGTINIRDVSYDALRAFINYLYTAEACLDHQLACDLLVMADKYQVQHLKDYCDHFLVSKLNSHNSLPTYAFAHQHSATHLLQASLSFITDNMDKLANRHDFNLLLHHHPSLVVDIYQAYLSKQLNTAAPNHSP